MSDAEDDYMSDKFLIESQYTKSSLINSRAKKREINLERKSNESIKKQKSALPNNESLQSALSKPLAEENKGFKLLAKMGYKPGQALGKPITNLEAATSHDSRLIQPIALVLKTDREGLGRKAALQELSEKRKERLRKQLGAETSIYDYRRRTAEKRDEKFVLNSLKKCQLTCKNLDIECNVEKPEMPWFWPERITDAKEGDTDDESNNKKLEELEDDFSNDEKMEMLTNYLRTSYMFCYWCGVRYSDEDDMKDNCPGLAKEDH